MILLGLAEWRSSEETGTVSRFEAWDFLLGGDKAEGKHKKD
jgi:hypothetical protein